MSTQVKVAGFIAALVAAFAIAYAVGSASGPAGDNQPATETSTTAPHQIHPE